MTLCLCTTSLCAVPRANSEPQNFKNEIWRPRGAAETNPVPAQTLSSSWPGLGAEVSHHLCFFPFPPLSASCLMRHGLFVSTELLRQSWECAGSCLLCREIVSKAGEGCQHIHPGGQGTSDPLEAPPNSTRLHLEGGTPQVWFISALRGACSPFPSEERAQMRLLPSGMDRGTVQQPME